jgi:hypothetical protein
VLLARDHIGNAAKGNGQLVESLHVGLGQQMAIEQERYLVSGIESGGEAESVAEAQRQ